ncbi:Transposase family tnp2 [Rhizoctonia solani]|uniref:Transposase family tnp2 n=1 Tax=Rhizoctonia solani TaxID=456999 RepID=A0A8H7IKL0_9AGAM|nr:Transposase family tnp2 [Rhizoctonia solani]
MPAQQPVQQRNSGQKLRKAQEMIRRTSIQAAITRQNSKTPTWIDSLPLLLQDLPPTDRDVWQEILHHRHFNERPDSKPDSHNTPSTQPETDRPDELDDISIETLHDHLGGFDLSTYGLSAEDVMDAEDIVEAVVEAHTLLEVEDIHNLSLFDLYVRYKPTEELFAELICRYQPIDSAQGARIPSIKRLRSLARTLSGFTPKRHHCCSAMKVVWIHQANLGTFLPPSPHSQLRALFACPITAEKMRHRHTYSNNKGTMADIFDSLCYLELCNLFVTIDGKPMPYRYFQEEHEVALGITLDAPDRQLQELARGVAAVDVNQRKLFSLRAHPLTIFGDIPALTKVLEFIGHNGCFPCRFCLMPTVPGPTSGGGFHRYCPLHQPNGFRMDPLNLPLREHDDTIKTGLKVLKAKNEAERKQLATESGVKGVTLFARVPSISIPRSFPVDLMHMIWQNLLPQLIDLWTGDFNDLDGGLEDYELKKDVWGALCEACIPSRQTMPTSFGCAVPDPRKRSYFIAETWNVFTTQLAPSLLRKRFSDQRYYRHFVCLVKLLSLVVSFNLPRDKTPEIRQGFAEWVEEYEQIYYQFDEDRLQTCPVNVHYLLHIADSIEYMGPICRRYPYANIDERVLNRARLQIILRKHRLIDKEPFTRRRRPEESDGATLVRGYPLVFLLSPHSKHLRVDRQLRRQIIRYLTTCFEILSSEAEAIIPEELEQWGRLRIGNGGDEVHARGFHKLRPDGRDAAFVRYQLMVDQDANDINAAPRFEEESQYGELQHIFVLTIPPSTRNINPHRTKKRHLLLAQLYEVPVEIDETDEYKVIWYKGKLGSGEVVDVQTIQCSVGRIKDGNVWWIVDRSADNTFAYPEFID